MAKEKKETEGYPARFTKEVKNMLHELANYEHRSMNTVLELAIEERHKKMQKEKQLQKL